MQTTRCEWVIRGVALASVMATVALPAAEPLKLWYNRPATNWNQALPLGNGRLGAMVFGGAPEHLQLNEESLWAGAPVESWPENYFAHLQEVRRLLAAGRNREAHNYGVKHLTAPPTSFRSYEPLADLWLDFADSPNNYSYRRELDLSDGVARVSCRIGKAEVRREAFVSAPDDVLVLRVTTDQPGTLGFGVRLARARNAIVSTLGTNQLQLEGQIVDVEERDGGYEDNPGGSGPGGAHMKFAGRLLVRVKRGSVNADNGHLTVAGADEAVILFTAATDYNLAKLDFDRSVDPGRTAAGILARAARKPWDELLTAHLQEHRALMDRVSLQLPAHNAARAGLPTETRLAALKPGEDDPGLVALRFQFGRYLLMNSSRRPGRLPANLQGIWNDRMWAPWESDYHLNINLQMNYWPARTANLLETEEPLLDWIELLAARGRETASGLYHAGGWAAFLATNPFGRVSPSASTLESQFLNASLDPLCGAWMAAEMFDHFQFSGDRAFLQRLWPILEGACGFILDTLVAAPDGSLVISPSTSPENSYIDPATGQHLRITVGSTYHTSIVSAVLDATDRAAAILRTGEATRRRIQAARAKLAPIRLGPDGRILEWSQPYKEAEPGHRHMSHLIGLHPFDLITPQTPELFEGARKTLNYRLQHGSGGIGWSRAWMINFFARLGDGEAAHQHCLALLRESTLPNLFNNVPMLQIDGNFGGTAGLCEMLLQSHERLADAGPAQQEFILHLLPALPRAWATGSVKGLCARGGFTVDMEWRNSRVVTYRIESATPRPVIVRCNGQEERIVSRRRP